MKQGGLTAVAPGKIEEIGVYPQIVPRRSHVAAHHHSYLAFRERRLRADAWKCSIADEGVEALGQGMIAVVGWWKHARQTNKIGSWLRPINLCCDERRTRPKWIVSWPVSGDKKCGKNRRRAGPAGAKNTTSYAENWLMEKRKGPASSSVIPATVPNLTWVVTIVAQRIGNHPLCALVARERRWNMTNASGSSRLWGLTKMIGGAALVWFAGRALRKPEEAGKDEVIPPHSAIVKPIPRILIRLARLARMLCATRPVVLGNRSTKRSTNRSRRVILLEITEVAQCAVLPTAATPDRQIGEPAKLIDYNRSYCLFLIGYNRST